MVGVFMFMKPQREILMKTSDEMAATFAKSLKRKNLHLVILVFILAMFFTWPLRFFILRQWDKVGVMKINILDNFDEKSPVFITTICGEKKNEANSTNDLVTNVDRQIEQTVTLIKSATVLSTSHINFIIVVDHDWLYDKVVEEVGLWPEEVLRKLSLQRRNVWFPEGSVFKNLFRPCASARLFFPDHMPDIESAIYVDTDMLFLRSPEELWREFNYFDSIQMSGIAGLEYYNPALKIPYYGQSGLNAGLWMMNMTRMRNFPGGWENRCYSTFEEYKENINLADQDIANIIFSKDPNYLYPIGCRWNFRSFVCKSGINICEESKEKGIFLLHGNELKFFKDDLKMKAMYEVWKNFQPGRPLTDLLSSFKRSLKKVDEMKPSNYCSKVDGIDRALMKGLEDHILALD